MIGTIVISATSTGTGSVVLQNSPSLSNVRINGGGLHVLGGPDMSTQGAGIGWNYSGGTGETNFFNNNANGVVPGGWTWIPTTNTSVGSPAMTLSQAGTLACSNITVTTSNSNDALTLINTVQTNTIITIGRSNNTGNVAQIYMSYIGNNDSANNFAIAFGGKSPVVQFFNDYSTTFSSRVLINIPNSSYTSAMFTVNNTSTNPAVSTALLGPNIADGQSIQSIHGKSANAGNTMVTSYTHVSSNNANNSYGFGFYEKSNNLVLKNDLSSSFGGKLAVAAGVRILNNGLHILATPDMSTEGAGIGWNYSGGVGETNFFNNNGNGVVPGGWTWIPTTNTSVGSPVMSLSQAGNLSCTSVISSGSVRAGSILEWGSNFFGKLSWNVSLGSGEIAIQNMYPTPEWHTIFYKNDGMPILRIGNNGQLSCSNITVTTSNSNDVLQLINTAQTNTIITIGRSNNTGNVAQIYMSYIGNNDPANNFAIAFGGKSPVVQFFNDFSTKFSGRVLINTTSSSYTDPVFSITNTSNLPLISMALLAPNVAGGQGILSIHGKSGDAGNTMVTSYNHVSSNNANNSYSFGFYNKSNNLVLKNDLSSSFGGKVEVAAGVKALGGLYVVGTPDMSTQGVGIGWNYSNGFGETNFFNNNANGGVPGGWNWLPTTNTSVGSPAMSLSQTGNLLLSGTITASNLTVINGSWTPVLTCTNYNGVISQVHNTIAIGRYSISGKTVTLFYLISFDIYGGTPLDEWIILKGIPTICRVQPFQGNVGNQCSVAGEVSWFNSNIAGTANPIRWIVQTDGAIFGGNPYAQPPPYFGLGNIYDGLGIYFYAEYPQGLTGYTDQRMSGYITYIIP